MLCLFKWSSSSCDCRVQKFFSLPQDRLFVVISNSCSSHDYHDSYTLAHYSWTSWFAKRTTKVPIWSTRSREHFLISQHLYFWPNEVLLRLPRRIWAHKLRLVRQNYQREKVLYHIYTLLLSRLDQKCFRQIWTSICPNNFHVFPWPLRACLYLSRFSLLLLVHL